MEAFEVKDCALIAIATGERAQNLRELRDRLATTDPGCIYYHFWGRLLRARFEDPEYQNDFAAWTWRDLHDERLAERLAIIDPTDFGGMEELRRELIDVIEERLDESDFVPWARMNREFFFVRSQIVVFDTHIQIKSLEELSERISMLSRGSIFYHFIDARRRTDSGRDDFSEWLVNFGPGCAEVSREIAGIDPYFNTLSELRNQLAAVLKVHARAGVPG